MLRISGINWKLGVLRMQTNSLPVASVERDWKFTSCTLLLYLFCRFKGFLETQNICDRLWLTSRSSSDHWNTECLRKLDFSSEITQLMDEKYFNPMSHCEYLNSQTCFLKLRKFIVQFRPDFPTDWMQNMSLKGHSKRSVISHVMDVWSVYLQTSVDKRREIQCAWHPYYTDRIWRGRIRKHVKGIRWEAKDKITVSAGLIFVLASRVDAFRNVEM